MHESWVILQYNMSNNGCVRGEYKKYLRDAMVWDNVTIDMQRLIHMALKLFRRNLNSVCCSSDLIWDMIGIHYYSIQPAMQFDALSILFQLFWIWIIIVIE